MQTPSQAIDWPGIRAAAVVIGVRAAARQAARDLPPDERKRFEERVSKRAVREGWAKQKNAAIAAQRSAKQGPVKPLSTNVQSGQSAITNQLADDGNETRAYLSTATKRAAGSLARSKHPTSIVRQASELKAIAQTASIVHAWDANRPNGGFTLNLGVVIGGMAQE